MDPLFTDYRDEVARIATLAGEERRDAINDFLNSQATLIREMSFHSLRHHSQGQRDSELVNDVMQVYAMTALRLIEQETSEPGSISGLDHRWEAVLTHRGKVEAQVYLDHSANAAPTELRRARYLRTRRNELAAQLGRDPENSELLAYANEWAATRRADAARQSLQFTLDDVTTLLAPLAAASDVDEHLANQPVVDEDVASDYILSRFESPSFVRAVVDRAQDVSVRCGQVAQAWFGEFLDGRVGRRVLESDEIAHALGLSRKQVNRTQARIREIAIIVAQDMGITSSE